MAHPDNPSVAVAPERDVFDADGRLRAEFVAAVEAAVATRDAAAARALAGQLHEADLGALIEALDHETRPALIELMGDDFDFAALTEVDDQVREDILDELRVETVADGVRDLEYDDAVTILEDLDKAEQAEILDALPAIDRYALQRSLDFAENTAGRLMQTTLVALPPFWSAEQTIIHLRAMPAEELPDSFFEVFVADPGGRLLGTVFLDALLRARGDVLLADLMQADRRRVTVAEDQEEVARIFERYNLVSVPVVDAGDRLVGVITIDDIVDVIQEEAEEDMRALGGVSAREELSDSFWVTARNRFLWLFVNLVTAFIASSVLKGFEDQIGKMVALAVLAPIVASQGGNAATQTMTVAVRALATQDLSATNAVRIFWRETLVGLLNGLAFGLLTGLISAYWFGIAGIGACIAIAMLTNLVAGAIGGFAIPVVLNRLRIDPAIASSAFVTTVTDVVGYSSFLAVATLWFGLG